MSIITSYIYIRMIKCLIWDSLHKSRGAKKEDVVVYNKNSVLGDKFSKFIDLGFYFILLILSTFIIFYGKLKFFFF
jgi:hypothetical protein